MTFYGESVAIDRRTNLVGAAVANVADIQVRAGSATFTAGDSTRVASDLAYTYLEPGDVAVVSWVVEVLSGSGTMSFAEGLGNTSTSLGSQSITGPAQVVIPSLVLTAENVIEDTDARLLVTCDSGTLVVQQIKLRVWPPEGAGGGWSDPYPSWTLEAPVSGARVGRTPTGDAFIPGGSAADAWAAAIADAQTRLDEPWANATESIDPPLGLDHALVTSVQATNEGEGAALFDLWAFAVVGGAGDNLPLIDDSLGLVDGVDYIVPPDEVDFDIPQLLQGLGDRSWEWTNVGVWVSGDTGPGGAMLLSVDDHPDDLIFDSWPDTSASPMTLGQNSVTMPPGEAAVFAESHSWFVDGVDYPGGTSNNISAVYGWRIGVGDPDTEDFAPLSNRVTYPPYRVWNPAQVVEDVKFLRVIQRGDGLGMGSGRVLGSRTRQSTVRVIGTP